MLIIGEKINNTSKNVQAAIDRRDAGYIAGLALAQRGAGAQYVDINSGINRPDEAEALEWMVRVIQERSGVRFSIDTFSASHRFHISSNSSA